MTRRAVFTALAATTLLVLGLAATPAHAQSPAAHHYRAATSYYAQGRYKDALREFRESYRLSKKPELQYNIGQTFERMGQMAAAVKAYRRYLAESKAKNPTLLEKIKNLVAKLKNTGIRIDCKVAGAEVVVDGKVAGKTPLGKPVTLKAGSHNVVVRKSGHRSFSAFVSVTVGSIITVTAKLPVDTSASSSGTGSGGAANTAGGSGTNSGGTSGGSAGSGTSGGAGNGGGGPSDKGGGGRMWTWIVAGVSGALLATAAITGAVALNKAGDATSDSDPKADSSKRFALASDLTLAFGLAGAAGAVVLFFLEGKAARKKSAAASATRRAMIVPAVGPGFGGVSAALRF